MSKRAVSMAAAGVAVVALALWWWSGDQRASQGEGLGSGGAGAGEHPRAEGAAPGAARTPPRVERDPAARAAHGQADDPSAGSTIIPNPSALPALPPGPPRTPLAPATPEVVDRSNERLLSTIGHPETLVPRDWLRERVARYRSRLPAGVLDPPDLFFDDLLPAAMRLRWELPDGTDIIELNGEPVGAKGLLDRITAAGRDKAPLLKITCRTPDGRVSEHTLPLHGR